MQSLFEIFTGNIWIFFSKNVIFVNARMCTERDHKRV